MSGIKIFHPEVRQVWKSSDLTEMSREFIQMPEWEEIEYYFTRDVKLFRIEEITQEQLDQSQRMELDILKLTHRDDDYAIVIEPSLEPFSLNYKPDIDELLGCRLPACGCRGIRGELTCPVTDVDLYVDRIMVAIDSLLPSDEVCEPIRLPCKFVHNIDNKTKSHTRISLGYDNRRQERYFYCVPELNHVDYTIVKLVVADTYKSESVTNIIKKIKENLLAHRRSQLLAKPQ